ncbi:MAG: CHAT domain-containing protein [Candidatus Promineifilaceae bacterium]
MGGRRRRRATDPRAGEDPRPWATVWRAETDGGVFWDDTKTTILFLTANPLDTDQLRLSAEVHDIKAALRQAEYGRRFDVQEEWAVRISDLRRALLRYADQPLILHFSGHGNAGAIYLENKIGRTQPVAAQALARFLAHFPNIQCIVLNACYSNEVGDALVTVAPCVVGMATDVTDVAAIQFAEAFYDAIGAGKSFAHTFRLAETSAEMEGILDFVRPVFRGHEAPPATPPVGKQELAELVPSAPKIWSRRLPQIAP